MTDTPGRQPERDDGEKDDDDLAPGRVEECDRQHDPRQPGDVERAPHAQRLDLRAVAADGIEGLARELHRVVDEERGQQRHQHEPPVRQEPERPRERNAFEIPEEERRVAERRQHPPDVRNDEDEEDDRVLHAGALSVRLQERAHEQHGRAGRSHERGEQAADGEEGRVRGRRRDEVAAQQDAAGDHEEPREQDDERDVVDGGMHERGRVTGPVHREHR